MEIVLEAVPNSVAVGIGGPAADIRVIALGGSEGGGLPLRECWYLRKNRDAIQHHVGFGIVAYQIGKLKGRCAAATDETEVVMLKCHLRGMNRSGVRRCNRRAEKRRAADNLRL